MQGSGVGCTGGPLAYTGGPAQIGRDFLSTKAPSHFAGGLDEVTLYDRALDPGEIRRVMDPCAGMAVPVRPRRAGLRSLRLRSAFSQRASRNPGSTRA